MQRKDLYEYEYAVIRVVPRIEREEFINTGVILFSKKEKYLGIKYFLNREKLSLFSDELDYEFIESNLHAFERICRGDASGGKIAKLDIPERFRWITAIKSTGIQTSRPHPGLSTDLEQTLEKLFQELVL